MLSNRGLSVAVVPPSEEEVFAREMASCQILWHVLKPVTRAVMEQSPALRLVQKMGAGLDTIDLDAARDMGIAVCNLPGTNAQAVAEHALLLMLSVLRKITCFDREIRGGQGWAWPIERQGELGEIHGRTVGLVGFGATASRLAPMLTALGARVLYTALHQVPTASATYLGLEELLQRSDIVSLHLPLDKSTVRLLDRSRIGSMKRGAILINTARGGLVDQEALADALRSGHIAAAGIDTFAVEPVEPISPVLGLENVVLTPHVAWLTRETFERSIDLMVENCRRLAAGEQLLHRVV
jgi:phosphoglycerate dehydrogenase-like enzyme